MKRLLIFFILMSGAAGAMAVPGDLENSERQTRETDRIECTVTDQIWLDEFSNTTLDTCWRWLLDPSGNHSLTARPGWLRLWTSNVAEGHLGRDMTCENAVFETKVQINPGTVGGAGLYVWFDSLNSINIVRQPNGGVRAHSWYGSERETVAINQQWSTCYFRMVKRSSYFTVLASPDSQAWTTVATWNRGSVVGETVTVGLDAYNWPANGPELPADFDYFRVELLPGTAVCGNVWGVWDSTGSPYYVMCDVTVPAGQTLEIRPGTRILFTGPFQFLVNGLLRAEGTATDSIVMTMDTPPPAFRWKGLRLIGAQDSSIVSYCVVDNAYWPSPDAATAGGGITIWNCSPRIEHCTVRRCESARTGGGIKLNNSNARISECRITASYAPYGGGIEVGSVTGTIARPVIEKCLIDHNRAGQGGGIGCWANSDVQISRCTIVENQGDDAGGLRISSGATVVVSNSILWGNHTAEVAPVGGAVTVRFSDVLGGYPGPGNAQADPYFTDAMQGNYHLQAGSPCINSGDPAAPPDPDSSRADMGAFPFMHDGLEIRPVAFDFGLLDFGTDSTQQLIITNPFLYSIPVISVTNTVPAFTVDVSGLNGEVAGSGTVSVPVRFFPAATGSYADTLVLTFGRVAGPVIIPLSGSAEILLPAVSQLVAQRGPLSGIRLDWAPITHSITGQPVQDVAYIVYGATAASGPYVPFGFAPTNSYVHPSVLTIQPVYFYRVTAETGLRAAAILRMLNRTEP
jgi:hypothetical protein